MIGYNNNFTLLGFGGHLALDQAHNKHSVGGIIVANKNNNRIIQDLQFEGRFTKCIPTKVKGFQLSLPGFIG